MPRGGVRVTARCLRRKAPGPGRGAQLRGAAGLRPAAVGQACHSLLGASVGPPSSGDSHASPAGWPGAFDETETDVSPSRKL